MLNLTLLGQLVIYNYNNYNSSDFCRLFLCGFRKSLNFVRIQVLFLTLGMSSPRPPVTLFLWTLCPRWNSDYLYIDMNNLVRDQIGFSFLTRLCANRASKRIFAIYCKLYCEDMFKWIWREWLNYQDNNVNYRTL